MIVKPSAIDKAELQAATRKSKARRSGNATRFTGLIDTTSESHETSNGSQIGAIASVDQLLALHDMEDPQEKKQRNFDYGQDMLEALEKIRNAIIMGNLSVAQLQGISDKLKKRPMQCDPKLDDLIDQIDLRAQVELAKLTRSNTN